MDKQIIEQYNGDILQQFVQRFGINRETIRPLAGFESFIYKVEKSGDPYILRISHSSRRTSDMINGEIEWLHYMSDHGIPAARAVASEYGRIVEIAHTGDSYFSAVTFERAKGGPPGNDDWTESLIRTIGQTLGRMHALTKTFKPSNPAYKRPEWYEEVNHMAEKYLPPSDWIVVQKFNALNQYFHSLPQDRDAYGLVHFDFHRGNFFVHDGHITLFDFDDCQYSWFAYDIAIALFYLLPHHVETEQQLDNARRNFNILMEGYSSENVLNPTWLKQIPHFLKHREIDLYTVIHRSLDLNNLDGWVKSFMNNRKYKIEHDVPYVEMDFE